MPQRDPDGHPGSDRVVIQGFQHVPCLPVEWAHQDRQVHNCPDHRRALFSDGRLGVSFFCLRDFENRSDLHYILPTLAFQLAHKYPEFWSILIPLLQSNPDIVHSPLCNQMETLIVKLLNSLGISTVIVIDVLDKCRGEGPQLAVLSVKG